MVAVGRHRAGLGFLFVLCACAAGCGPAGPRCIPVSGTVRYQGKALENGSVYLQPVDPNQGRVASGGIDAQGRFVISTFPPGGDGVLPGDYVGVVRSIIPGSESFARDKGTGVGAKLSTPARYTDAATSDLKVTVSANDSAKVLDWELTD